MTRTHKDTYSTLCNNLYGKKPQYVNRSETGCGRRGKEKNHPQDCNSPIYSSSNDEIKTAKAKKKC